MLSAEPTNTIAPDSFLPVHAVRFPRAARWVFHRLVAARHLGDNGTLQVVEAFVEPPRAINLGRGEPRVGMTVHDRSAYSALVFGGSKGLGRSFVNGQWSTSDITQLVRLLFRATQRNRRRWDRIARRYGWLFSLVHRASPSRKQDRENIHAHYDLSNEFFSLMLDETMAYSCAVFADESTSLHDAQVEKFDRLCRKLRLGPDDHVLEIGTGWGGFAIHAARTYGARVTTTTISENQRDGAVAAIRAAGLDDRVTVLTEHYAELTGSYDALVSVEMIEAVDWRRYDEFFSTCSRLLHDNGRMVIQAITIADQSFDRAKMQEDFIRDLIFPGGCLPSVTAMLDSVTRSTDLKPIDLEDIGLHYVRTLSAWRDAVHDQAGAVAALGFDDRFVRLWDLYLGYCEAAFLERHVSDVQLVLHKPRAVTTVGYRPA